jgi:hypothetical protein
VEDKRLDNYFYLSFMVSLLLWSFLFWLNPDFFQKGLFTTLFLIGSFHFWLLLKNYQEYQRAIGLCFLFQAFCLLGSGFEFNEKFPIYLSIVPLIGGLYFLKENQQKIFLLIFFVISVFGLKLVFNYLPFGFKESLAFFLALSWISGGMIFAAEIQKINVKEKYLVHDLLNHAHGLSLFLENRQVRGLSPSETKNISLEMESLKEILQTHFWGNKLGDKTIIELSKIPDHMETLCKQFLNGVKFEIKTNGAFKTDQIFFNEFLRGMGNVLKNVSESKAGYCEILIENQGNGVSIIVKNNFSKNLDKKDSGLGLKSTQEILEHVGGIFCFYSQDDLWVSRIFIPFINQQKKSA